MKNPKLYPNLHYLAVITGLILYSSCAPVNKLKFVADAGPGSIKNDYYNDRSEKTIQPYDYLYIKYSVSMKKRTTFLMSGAIILKTN